MGLLTELLDDDPTVQYMDAHTGGGTPVPDMRFFPEKCMLPRYYLDNVDKIKKFECRSDDVWIVTYPKCGTTWTQEMVWLMKNEYDFKMSHEVNAFCRVPFLEYRSLQDPNKIMNAMANVCATELLDNRPSPRVIKSHLPVSLLPSQLWTVKPKIIYVYRNPKDVVVSFYHHYQLLENYSGTLNEFVDAFLEGKVLYGYFWGNVLPFWERRNEPNVLFITFEDLKKDLKAVTSKVANFIDAKVPEDIEDDFFDHLSFGSMAKNPAVNFESIYNNKQLENKKQMRFIRKGETGGWKKALTSEQIQAFDDWSMDAIAGTDFPYYN